MKRPFLMLLTLAALGSVPMVARAQDKATKEQADALHQQAAGEADPAKALQLYCGAAALVPKNQPYQDDCVGGRRTLIARDRKYLTTAQDAADAHNVDKAKRYAGFVLKDDPKLDPETYKGAQQLLNQLSAPAQTASAAPSQPPPPPAANQSAALYGQANSEFKSGNLQAAKSAAQQVTDPSLKPLASDLVAEIDRYTGLVAEGQRKEAAKQYEEALSSFQAARALNHSVAGDDLNGRIERLGQQIALAKQPPPPPPAQGPKPGTETAHAAPPLPPKPAVSPEEKKNQLMAAYAQAIGRKDFEAAERDLRQVVQLDPRDAGAKAQLDELQKQVAEALNRDPAKLESTLREAILAFYGSDFDGSESKLNNYLRASGAKKKGAAYFYLAATEQAQALLQVENKRASRLTDARENFKQARSAGYRPVQKYVSKRILDAWEQAGL